MFKNLNNIVKPGDVVSIKLVSGEEIIAELVSCEGAIHVVSRPISLRLRQYAPNEPAQVEFAAFLMSVDLDTEVTIGESQMLCKPVRTNDEAAKKYRASTSPIIQ